MKRSRILLFLGALLLVLAGVLAGAPVARSHGLEAGSPTSRVSPSAHSREPARRIDGPSVVAAPGGHRRSAAATGAARRPGMASAQVWALVPDEARGEPRTAVAGIDAEADARMLRASNTPCCVRGPPVAA